MTMEDGMDDLSAVHAPVSDFPDLADGLPDAEDLRLSDAQLDSFRENCYVT